MVENVESPKVNVRQTASAMEAVSADEQERFIAVLDFWHKVEFFIPFDLDRRIAEADDNKIRYLYRQHLERGSSALWQIELKETKN